MIIVCRAKTGEKVFTEVNFWGWLWKKIRRKKIDLTKTEEKKRR